MERENTPKDVEIGLYVSTVGRMISARAFECAQTEESPFTLFLSVFLLACVLFASYWLLLLLLLFISFGWLTMDASWLKIISQKSDK